MSADLDRWGGYGRNWGNDNILCEDKSGFIKQRKIKPVFPSSVYCKKKYSSMCFSVPIKLRGLRNKVLKITETIYMHM